MNSQATSNRVSGTLHDPFDYRIGKSNNRYYLEGEHLEAVYDTQNRLKWKYQRGAVVDEVVSAFQYHSSDENDWSFYNFLHDQVQSTSAITDHVGNVVEKLSYSPYGNADIPHDTTQTQMLYTGRELDTASGLYYYRARYYDPQVKRFTSEDPLGFKAGMNFYAYVNNNPVNYIDPMGMDGINAGISIKIFGEGLTNTISIRYPGVSDEPWDLQLKPALSPGFITSTVIGWFEPDNPLAKSEGFELVKGTVNLGWDFDSSIGSGVDMNMDAHAGWKFLGATATYQGIDGAGDVPPFPSSFELNLGPQYGVSYSPEVEFTTSVRDIVEVFTDIGSSDNSAGGGYVLYPSKPNTNMMQHVYKK